MEIGSSAGYGNLEVAKYTLLEGEIGKKFSVYNAVRSLATNEVTGDNPIFSSATMIYSLKASGSFTFSTLRNFTVNWSDDAEKLSQKVYRVCLSPSKDRPKEFYE